MGDGHTLVLVLTTSLIFIPVIVTFGNSDYHEQARRKLATDIPGFISIDCGAAKDYYDNDTGIFYQSDAKFMDTGKIMNIPSVLHSEQVIRQQLKNLRSFPQGTKNCYTLKPEQGKNHTYMIRAFFNYGNYDGENQPPVFDLYLGVNKWDTVDSSTLLVPWKEIIHFSLTDNIYVCLVNTSNGIPFISALELRHLDSSIYKIDSGALQTFGRYDVGGSKDTRYPADIYDRIWNPLDPTDLGGKLLSTNSAIDTQSSIDAYYPPEEVLRTAAWPQNYLASNSLHFSRPILDTTLKYYVYFHFAEIEKLEDGQLREFYIYSNYTNIVSERIKLEYLKPLTKGPMHWSIEDTEFSFSIYETNESNNHPPILNAFETYVLKMLPDSPTDLEDVDAIMDIKQVYNVTRNWQGDPCVPSKYSWEGLNCSYNINPPRIISLNLASSGLTGKIASSLSNLKSLESLDLSYNGLTGQVPEFLAQLPSLRTLNLTGNKLSGSIPQAVMERVKNGPLLLSWGENPNLCDSCKAKKKKFVVPVVSSILILFFLSALIFWYFKRKRQGGNHIVLGTNSHSGTTPAAGSSYFKR